PPAFSTAWHVSSVRAASRPCTAMVAPVSASATLSSLPIPPDAPVINATLPSRENSRCSSEGVASISLAFYLEQGLFTAQRPQAVVDGDLTHAALSVQRAPADVRSQHNVFQAQERAACRRFVDESVQPCATQPPLAYRRRHRVFVHQLAARCIDQQRS